MNHRNEPRRDPGTHPAEPGPPPERWRWEQQRDQETREFQRSARQDPARGEEFARDAGDPRWGTGGLPVDEPSRRLPVREPTALPPGAAVPRRMLRGPYAGRGPRGYRRSDARIREDVCEAFTIHGYLDPSDVEVSVRGGEVTLSGTVGSRQQKRLAEDLADAVLGVVEVHNELRVDRGAHLASGTGA